MPETPTGREQLNRLKSGHTPLVQALFDEAYACGHKDGRADGEAVIGMLEAARSELAAAQAGPVVEWRDRGYHEGAKAGRFLLFVHSRGWEIRVEDVFGQQHPIVTGPETGPAGKAAAEAAYRRACGL